MRTVPLVNRLHNIVSVSTDGHLCVWSDNSLHEPSLELDLKAVDTGDAKRAKDEVTTNSFAFAGRDTNTIVLGSDEGMLYRARLYDKPGTSETAGIYSAIAAHDAPITAVEFHPVIPKAPGYVSDLYLTSSYDWTCKLWSHKSDKPLMTFESARDYIFDVQWSPVHPALFATGDGTGRLDLWNISGEADVPEVKVQLEAPQGQEGPAVSKLRWSDDGMSIAVGTSTGSLMVYAVDPGTALPAKDSAQTFFNKVAKMTA
jgi:dynein intermediate chain